MPHATRTIADPADAYTRSNPVEQIGVGALDLSNDSCAKPFSEVFRPPFYDWAVEQLFIGTPLKLPVAADA